VCDELKNLLTPAEHRISRQCPEQALVEQSVPAGASPKLFSNTFQRKKDARILGEPETTVHLP
jgi:hypothetical protein